MAPSPSRPRSTSRRRPPPRPDPVRGPASAGAPATPAADATAPTPASGSATTPAAAPASAPAPAFETLACPIAESLDVLGKKWTLEVLRDVVMHRYDRFGVILRNNPGMSARILSIRLHDLVEAGLVHRITLGERPRETRYVPTARGQDTLPILLEILRYGIKHHAPEVFTDGRPRELDDVLPERLRRARSTLLDGERP